jgi:hypothetical protein
LPGKGKSYHNSIAKCRLVIRLWLVLLYVGYVSLSCLANVNQEPTIEELFYWFPSGSYNFICHADLKKAKAGKGWVAAEEMKDASEEISSYNSKNWLPTSFKELCTSYTMAEPLKVKIDKGAFEDIPRDRRPRTFLARRANLCVYRFDSLPSMIKNALKSGEISDAGVSYRNFQIFSYEGINYGGERTKMFATSAFGLEWLVAEDLNFLRLMIATGLQVNPCILDDDTMADIMEIIPDLGETWMISESRPYIELQQEYYLRNGETEEDLKAWREEVMQQPVYTFSTSYFADNYSEREIRWFIDEEHAAQGTRITFSQRPSKDDNEKEYKKLLVQRQSTEVVGNLCIITTVYDQKLIDATLKYNSAQAEFWKKQREEEERE